MSWFRPKGSLTGDGATVVLDPATAGWDRCGLRVLELPAGGSADLDPGPAEVLVVPLSGTWTVEVVDGGGHELAGRDSVFAALTDVLYLPPATPFQLSSRSGGEVAVAGATADGGGDVFYRPASSVAVEVRGAGAASRQINQLLPAELAGPSRLIVVEVLTPAGNWSSYPPHKHDQAGEDECELEEIYYFRIAGEHGFGLHRTYTADGAVDDTVTVRTDDVYLVHRGYHGPCVAAPGYEMYYLNVMAGPERRWSVTFDPAHAWVMDGWAGMAADPRLPMTVPPARDDPDGRMRPR